MVSTLRFPAAVLVRPLCTALQLVSTQMQPIVFWGEHNSSSWLVGSGVALCWWFCGGVCCVRGVFNCPVGLSGHWAMLPRQIHLDFCHPLLCKHDTEQQQWAAPHFASRATALLLPRSASARPLTCLGSKHNDVDVHMEADRPGVCVCVCVECLSVCVTVVCSSLTHTWQGAKVTLKECFTPGELVKETSTVCCMCVYSVFVCL